MSVYDGLSYRELITQTELVLISQLSRSAEAVDLYEKQRYRELAHGALILWTALAYRVALKIGEVEQFDIDLERLNSMFPEGMSKL